MDQTNPKTNPSNRREKRKKIDGEIGMRKSWKGLGVSKFVRSRRERGREGGGGDELTNSRLCLRSRLVVGLVDEKQRGYP